MVADAGRGRIMQTIKKQRQVYIPQALVDRLLKAGEVYLPARRHPHRSPPRT